MVSEPAWFRLSSLGPRHFPAPRRGCSDRDELAAHSFWATIKWCVVSSAFFRNIEMASRRRRLLFPLVAVMATAGMLSMAGEASACSAKRASKTTRGCCAGSPRSVCCCDARTPELLPQSTGRSAVVNPEQADVGVPGSSCTCRLGEPANRASKSGSRPSGYRAEYGRAAFAVQRSRTLPGTRLACSGLPTGIEPESPLYLRTSRLLI